MGFFGRSKSKRKPLTGKLSLDKKATLDDGDDGSIGEALAPHDQFYLEIPVKRGPVGILRKHSPHLSSPHDAHGEYLEQASTVSSISYGSLEGGSRVSKSRSKSRRKYRSSSASNHPQDPANGNIDNSQHNIGCCAFQGTTTTTTTTTDNADNNSIAAAKGSSSRKLRGGLVPPHAAPTSTPFLSWLFCGTAVDPIRPTNKGPYPRHHPHSSNATVSTTPSYYQLSQKTSLFDTTLEEDDAAGIAMESNTTIALVEMDHDDTTVNTKGSRWMRRLRKVRSIPKLRGLKPTRWNKFMASSTTSP